MIIKQLSFVMLRRKATYANCREHNYIRRDDVRYSWYLAVTGCSYLHRVFWCQLYKVYKDQGGLCLYCGESLGRVWHLDHVEPFCCGGRNKIGNVVAVHPHCNMVKSNRSKSEWYLWLSENDLCDISKD